MQYFCNQMKLLKHTNMKTKLILSVLLLFVGVGMQAQSISAEQMDERFNDGTKMPYGWFAEGWIVADGSHRYFDLQGHQLNEKPRSGIYIKDGKKYSR